MDISPKRNCLALTAGKKVHIIALGENQLGLTMNFREEVECLSFSPDGLKLSSGEKGGILRISDVETGQEMGKVKCNPNGFYTVDWSPNGNLIAVGHYEPEVSLVDAVTFRVLTKLDSGIFTDSGRTCVKFFPDGKWLASTAYNTICIWGTDGKNFPMVRQFSTSRHGHILDIAVSPDGAWLAGVEDAESEYFLHVWEMSSGGKHVEKKLMKFCDRIVWLNDNLLAITELFGDGISFYKTPELNRQNVRLAGKLPKKPVALVFHTEGDRLFVATKDGQLLGWFIPSGIKM